MSVLDAPDGSLAALPAAARPDGELRVAMLIASMAVGGGGVPEALRMLSGALVENSGLTVAIFSPRGDDGPLLDAGAAPVFFAPVRGPRSFACAPDLARMIDRWRPDILHVHGLWSYLSIVARRWRRRTGKPAVVSPHGMLDPWALRNSYWTKCAARLLFEDRHLAGAACIHALCASERDAVRAAGFSQPVPVLPNGVVRFAAPAAPPPWRLGLPHDAKILLFLGRLAPKKGVAALIAAWQRVCAENPDWRLVLVGPDEGGYRRRLDELQRAGRQVERLHLVGPAYGDDRAAAYAAATAFILPSVSEGLPLTALEALAQGVPVLLSRQCNLPEAFEAGCGLALETGEEGIVRGLRALLRLSADDLSRMGGNGRRLAAERFEWKAVAAGFAGLYRSLAAARPPEA